MTGNEKFRLKVVDDLRKNRVIVESDEEYIELLKKANKDLGDLVRERDKQLAAAQAENVKLREVLGKIANVKPIDFNYDANDIADHQWNLAVSVLEAHPTSTTALQAAIDAAVKESNDRLYEEREIWDRMFGDGAKKLERLEMELDDCLYVLDALWDKKCNKIVTQKWAEILIRNKRDTGASSAEDFCQPSTE
jgi:hypothetical protein